ncbi:MAG: replicative DNA helicase [bacterium]|nr:replicative DNA helicase [bacterium]
MDSIHKLPPQSIEAETSVLGAMLLDKNAISSVIEVLNEDAFYKDAHAKIYKSIINLFDKNEPVDLVTLSDNLKKEGVLEAVGGVSYLATILNSVPTAANIEHYAQIVQNKAISRKLISTCTEIINSSYAETGEVNQLLDNAEQLIFNIVSRKVSHDFVSVADMLHDSFETIEKLYADRHNITGVPSGFIDLDKITSGFQPSDLIIIAGRPSMGKSSFCLNIAQYVGTKAKMPVAIFSLEMSKDQLVQRLLCAEARVKSTNLRSGFLQESDWPKLTTSAGILSESSIFIDDTPGISILELRTKSRRIKAKYNIEMIIIDYLQLMQGRKGIENRQQEISEISRSLKALARELSIPIVALSQLSRAVEGRSDRRPQLSDLRESGAIEQDADLVAFIYRPEYYNPTPENEGIAEIIIGKHRHGPTENFKLAFIKEYTKFENLSTESISYHT